MIRVSGEVLDLAVDSRAVYTAGVTDFIEAGALIPMPVPVDSTQPACPRTEGHALAFGTVRSASGAVLPAAELRFFWRDQGGAADSWLQTQARTQATGRYRVCGLPRDRLMTVQVFADGQAPAEMTLRIASPRPAARLDLVLVPAVGEPRDPE